MIIKNFKLIDLTQLTDYEIGWVILNLIIRQHDHGGTSHGRSLPNALLHEILGLLKKPQIGIDEFEECHAFLMLEAESRVAKLLKYSDSDFLDYPPQQRLMFFDVKNLSNDVLADVLMMNLFKYYYDEAQSRGGYFCVEALSFFIASALIQSGAYIDEALWLIQIDSALKEARLRNSQCLDDDIGQLFLF